MTEIKPLGDKVLLERLGTKETTVGGIIIPETTKEKPQEAKVIATGAGRKDESGNIVALSVKEGDIVLISKWGGTEIQVDNKDYLIVSEDNILATIVH